MYPPYFQHSVPDWNETVSHLLYQTNKWKDEFSVMQDNVIRAQYGHDPLYTISSNNLWSCANQNHKTSGQIIIIVKDFDTLPRYLLLNSITVAKSCSPLWDPSVSLCYYMKGKWKSLSCFWLLVTPWTVAHQAPLSMEFSRQEYWNGLPLASWDHPSPGIKPRSLALQADSLPF